MKKMLKLSSLLFLLLCSLQQSYSQTTSWKGTGNANWNNVANWTNGIPDATKDAVLGDANFTGVNQPKVNVTSNCKSVTIGGIRATTLTFTRTLNVFGNLTINSNGIIAHPNTTCYVKGNWTNNGKYSATTTTTRIIFNGTSQTVGGTAVTTFRKMTVNATSIVTLTNSIKVDSAGSFLAVYGILDPGQSPTYNITSTVTTRVYDQGKIKVNAATFAANYTLTGTTTLYAGSIVDYSSTTIDQIVSSAYSYVTLMISGTGTKSLAANLPLIYGKDITNGKILITGGTFDIKTFTANRATTKVGGLLSIADGASLKVGGLSNFPLNFATRVFGVASTVEYNGVDQTVSTQNYGNLLVSTTGIKTAAVALSIMGNLTITNGTFNTNAVVLTHSIAGNFTMTGGSITGTNSTYVLNGTTDQALSLLSNILKLTISKVSGNVNLGSNITVTNTLNFTKGIIVTGNYNVIIPASGTVTGAGPGIGWINGNLQKNVATGAGVSRVFEIGEVDYSPVSATFASVTVAGALTANAKANDQSEVNYSGLDPAKSVNRFWSLKNTGISFNIITASFNWVAPDVDAGATTTSFKAGLFNGTTWSLPAVSSPLSTSIQVNNLTTLGDFSVGEKITRTTWTGNALTSDWFTPKNWLGLIPSTAVPTYISNGIAAGRVYPILTAGTGIVNNLTVGNAASLTISSGTLKVKGILSSPGTITASNGTVEFNGTSSQTIAAGTFANNTINNLIASGNLNLAGTTILTGTINIANGKTFATNDNLILRSTATGTARIATLPVNGSGVATAYITGNVSIERYIPARKAWRLLSTPIKTAALTTITESWQEDAYISSFGPNPNPNPGYGVHIVGGPVANGFDQSPTNSPTIKVYDYVSNSFIGLPQSPGTFIPLNSYPGYLLYIRGDRSIDLSQGANAAVTSTTLRMKGQINTGSQVLPVGSTNSTVFGNPYPSPVNFATLTKNNVKNNFYAWDPKLAGTYGLGGYVTVSWNSASSSYDITTSASGVTQYIPSGEAILVESLDGINPGTITVKESDKTANGSDFMFGRQAFLSQKLRTNLYATPKAQDPMLLDAALTTYDDAGLNEVDKNDVRKIATERAIISLQRDGSKLAIERRKTISGNDTTFLNMSLKIQEYKLVIIAENLNKPGFNAILKDNFSADINNTPVDMNGTTEISFAVTSDPASYAADRFSIVFLNSINDITAASRHTLAPEVAGKISNEQSLTIYPNPVQNNTVSLQLAELEKGVYNIQVFNISGQMVKKLSVQHNGGMLQYNFLLDNKLPAGKYQVKFNGGKYNLITSMIKE